MDNNYSYNAQIVSAMPKIIPVHKLRDSRAGREILLAAGRSSVETLARSQRDRRRRKSITGPFVGWDGEGVTISDGSHIYTLMANSYGDTLSDPGGLRTLDILQWITDIARRDSQANHVIFGGSYDANMILADLTFDEISTLVHTGCVWIRDNDYAYAMRYLPRKYLHIIRYARHSDKRDSSIKLYDTIGTFQSSFVAACEAWLPSAELGFIKEMKANRSTFQPEDMSTITDYCVMECQLLVQLMGLVRSHAHSVGIYPTRWDGAGAMAAVLLKTHKVKLYMTPTIDPTIQKCERYAYFGGRIELVRFGHYNGPVFAHDLVGAYPSVLPELPCLEHGNWTTERDISLDKVAAIPPYSIYHVTYKAGDIKRNFYPFPTRREDKRVLYPPKVCGWYWQAEVLAAIQYLEPNDTLIIHQAVSFAPHCDHIPYDFIPELASHKQALKAEHHDGYRVLKLAMNSLYGKHAQRVGANVLHTPPTYHQLGWAGYITSTIRARIYRLAMANPESVIAFETDGIYSTTRLVDGESDSGELGSWDVTEYPSGITYVQSGIYWVGGNAKYRGLDKGTLTEDMVLNAWANGDSTITGQTTRFRTMRTSLLSDYRWDDWRKWVTESRELTLEPRGKRIHVTTECRSCLGSENMSTLHDTWAVGGDGEMSVAHSLPWLTDEPDTDDYAGDDDSDLETWEC